MHLLNFTLESDSNAAQKIKLKRERGKFTLKDIKVFEPMRQNPNITSPCSIQNGGCSHLCLASSNAQKYSCSCPRGIRLVDKFNCAAGNEQILVLALRNGLRKISLDTPDFSDVIVPINQNSDQIDAKKTNIVAVDYDPVENKIYWTANMETDLESTKQAVYPDLPGISSIYPNGTGRELIIDQDIDHSDGLAVDYLGNFKGFHINW